LNIFFVFFCSWFMDFYYESHALSVGLSVCLCVENCRTDF
jgi:hypothetical protein